MAWQPGFHPYPFLPFISEARYNGAEIFNISPDINPSHSHADFQVPINGTTDGALALSLVQVVFDEDLADWEFIREQTDLSLLVRTDTGRYLRAIDLTEYGREDQLYQWDPAGELHKADRGNLKLGGIEVALSGSFEVILRMVTLLR